MARKLKPRRLQVPESPKDRLLGFGHNLLLAGLGAAAKVAEEGPKLFAALVKDGEAVQARADADRNAAPGPRSVGEAELAKIEQAVTERTARVLDGLNVASRSDIQTLVARIEALEQKTRTLATQTAAEPDAPSPDTDK